MTNNEVTQIKVYNPFQDEFEFVTATVEVQREDNGKFVGVNLSEAITEGGVDLMKYLSDDKLDEIEQTFLEVYEG